MSRIRIGFTLTLCLMLAFAGCSDDTSGTENNTSGANNATNNGSNNTNNTNGTNNGCMAETDQELCAAEGATCGGITVVDRCDETRNVTCGNCNGTDTCSDANVCVCAESDAEFCARLMKDCGEVSDTDACGNSRTANCGECADELCGGDNVCGCPCRIMGQCVPEGMANPENPCEVCDPDTSTNDWTALAEGSACDDGLGCTTNTVCDVDGACVGNLMADSCLIDEACYTSGDADPDSDCRTCDAAASTTDWTNLAEGTTCDDGLACSSNDACDAQGECVSNDITAGTCAIDDTCYNQGDLNPDNPCEICNPGDDQEGWSDVSVGTTCDDGLACTSNTACDGGGECVGDIMAGTCAIDGVCYDQDDANPNNACEACDAAGLQTDWSAAAEGSACDDGFTCTSGDVCTAGQCEGTLDATACLIDDTCYTDGDNNPTGRVCLVCDVSEDQEDWTFLPVDTSCDDGLACTGDGTCNPGGACRDGDAMAGTCAIDGACYMDGDVNPMNPCESCQAALENAAWSPRTGEICDDGLACTSSDMCSAEGTCVGTIQAGSCAIEGNCYADDDPNPANGCEFCDADADATEWADTAQGSVCDDGLACTSGTLCDGNGLCEGGTVSTGNCAIDGACYADGDANPLNDCEICTEANSQTGWSPNDGALCSSDGDGLSCTGVCNQDQCVDDVQPDSCVIDNACYADGDANPINSCEVCSAADDTQAWSDEVDGTACGPGGMNICCAGVCTNAASCP